MYTRLEQFIYACKWKKRAHKSERRKKNSYHSMHSVVHTTLHNSLRFDFFNFAVMSFSFVFFFFKYLFVWIQFFFHAFCNTFHNLFFFSLNWNDDTHCISFFPSLLSNIHAAASEQCIVQRTQFNATNWFMNHSK